MLLHACSCMLGGVFLYVGRGVPVCCYMLAHAICTCKQICLNCNENVMRYGHKCKHIISKIKNYSSNVIKYSYFIICH